MLDNPIWHSLSTRHSYLAIGTGGARRYPPEVAPFLGAEHATKEAARDAETIVGQGERVGVLGVIPPLLWSGACRMEALQYIWPEGAPAKPDDEAERLGEDHIPAMLDLTALVYPAYFRPGTARLGPYFGIFRGGRLVAMAGIRMAMDGYQELSAICTHPDWRSKGLAGRLTRHLVHLVLQQGDQPFLHTESDNPAQGMYERLGFRLRRTLPFHVLDR